MGLFSALVKSAIETVKLPVAVVEDVLTLGNAAEPDEETHTAQQLKKIEKAAEDEDADDL